MAGELDCRPAGAQSVQGLALSELQRNISTSSKGGEVRHLVRRSRNWLGMSVLVSGFLRIVPILLGVGFVAGFVGGSVKPARADGAFPEAQSVLLPRDRPNEIVLATTFGLVSTEDGGATWHFSCEASNTPMVGGGRYAMGPPPEDRIYAKTDIGPGVSSDSACTWSLGSGGPPPIPDSTVRAPFDIFPDPTDPNRVFALFQEFPDPGVVFRSLDAGATYAGPLYTTSVDTALTGIESSSSDPRTVYVTTYQGPGYHPRLVTSLDGGDTWNVADLEPQLGTVAPSLAAVDPADARKIYLRVNTQAGLGEQYQGIAITTDGGSTWTLPLKVPGGALAGFVRLSDQILLAIGQTPGANVGDPTIPTLFRSEDAGQTFVSETLPFHPLGLSQRDGIAYVVTPDLGDGFALTSSSDSGRTWTPRLRFRNIVDVKECVRKSCSAACDNLAGLALFPASVCNPPNPTPSSGGGCAMTHPVPAGLGAALLLAGLLGASRIRRSLRRPSSSSSSSSSA